MNRKNPDNTGVAESGCFLPDFCSARVVFLVVLIAQLLAFVLALAAAGYSREFWTDLAFTSVFIQWVALGSAAVLCLLRSWLERLSTLAAALFAFGATIAVNALFTGLIILGVDLEILPGISASGWDLEFAGRNLAIGAIVAAVAFRYFYVQSQWKHNVEAEARSRIQALQARIRPHFLFNSMNTIANLTRSQPDVAEQAIEDLSDVFRAALEQRERIALSQELDIVRRYLNIEALRLGPRLELHWDMGEDVPREARLPALTLQPLVENAIYHGIEPRTEGGEVRVAARVADGKLILSVENPLPGRRNRSSSGNQIAQENIRQRLALAYGERAQMRIEESEQRYRVEVRIPLEVNDEGIGG